VRRLAVIGLLLALAATLAPAGAKAHPLGNFTINRYSRLEVSPDGLRVRYVLDFAEIPTFQALPSIDADGDGRVSPDETEAFARGTLEGALPRLSLTVDGTPVPLRLASSEAHLQPGQAGLQTMLVSAWLEAPGTGTLLARRDAEARIEYRDGTDPDRVGWREIVVRAPGLAGRDVSDELRTYPEDLLQSPLDVRRVGLRLSPDGTATLTDAPAAPAGDATPIFSGPPSLSRATGGLADLLTRTTLTPPLIATALLTAILLGAMHALSPGHGKTVVGAYLVGSRGTPGHALFLGLTVTLVHTAGVFALGLATLLASHSLLPERVYPWLSLASGLLVLGMGLSLLRVRLGRVGRSAGDHTHGTHDHGFGAHSHDVPGADGGPVTWRGLLALGVSGGLLPCPSALVVMLGAIALQRVIFGLVLIVAFSAGLAATLTGIGLALVYSGRVAGRLAGRLGLAERGGGPVAPLRRIVRLVPAFSAAVVALAGLGLTVEAGRQLDLAAALAGLVLSPPPASTLSALSAALAAVAGALWLRDRGLALVRAGAGDGHTHGLGDDHGHDHLHGLSHSHDHSHDHDHSDGHDHGPGYDRGHGQGWSPRRAGRTREMKVVTAPTTTDSIRAPMAPRTRTATAKAANPPTPGEASA
jgi:nickel/cobalt transporter (NicO) family protein